MLQDARGFIWIGTEDGLNKYDGIDFHIYRHDPADSTTLSSNFILRLYEDRFGAIWVVTGMGLDRLDPVTGLFQHYQSKLYETDTEVRCLYEDRAGVVWIGTNRGLQRFDRHRDKFQHVVGGDQQRSSGVVRLLMEDSSGTFWLVRGEAGLHTLDRETGELKQISLPGEGSSVEVRFITALHEDLDGVFWLGTFSAGLVRFLSNSGRLVEWQAEAADSESLKNVFIRQLTEGRDGTLWIASEANGVYAIDRERKQASRFSHNASNPNSLSSNSVASILLDRANILWVGTAGGGINRFDPEKKKFSQLQDQLKGSPAFARSLVWAVREDSDGNLWVGTHANGAIRVDRSAGTQTVFRHDRNDAQSLSGDLVYCLEEDEFGTIWVGTANRGLNAFDRRSGRFKRYWASQKSEKGLRSNAVRRLYADGRGSLWIGTMGRGLSHLNIATGEFVHYESDPENPNSLSGNFVSSVFEDSEEILWVGAEGSGLNKLVWADSSATPTIIRYEHEPSNFEGLSNNSVLSICEAPRGTLWLGTSYGLNRFDPQSERFRQYTSKDGLPNNVVYGILSDDDGYLWLSTNKGLAKFDPRTERFKNYDLEDGLQSREFNSGAFFKSPSGEMFFGGVRGLNFFYPSAVKDNPNVPPILITGLRRFDEPVAVVPRQPVELSHTDNFIRFDFVALNYTNPQKNRYAYKLVGFNEDWIDGGQQRYATFTNLDPGQYTFRVKGSNNDGVWNEEGASIGIIISPPFWQAAWFRFLVAMVTVLVLSLVFWHQRSKARKKAELDKRIAELKLQALRAQMNPHFVFNTINSIQYFISSNEKKAAFQYLSKFSKLMRKMLENAEKSSLPISEELDSLKLYLDLEQLRFEGRFEYELRVDESIDVDDARIPTLLIQPFVENAIHHGLKFKRSKGALKINLEQKNGSLLCTIEDNGIGIEKALEMKGKSSDHHKSTGMKVTRQRLETLNALKKNGQGIEIIDLSRRNGGAHGTKVRIVIPLES